MRRSSKNPSDQEVPRLLIVEDDVSLRSILVLYLRRRGYQVDEAENGLAALHQIEALPEDEEYDLILSDIRMPEMDGDELLHEIRLRSEEMARRVILMTGFAHVAEDPELLANLRTRILHKPFQLNELADLIQQFVSDPSTR